MKENGNYRFIVRSLELANYLTTKKGFEIKSVRDGDGNYKVFFFDDSEELRQAIDEWIVLRNRKEELYAKRQSLCVGRCG